MKKSNVDFNVVKEDFTMCKTSNGLILKLKQALIELQHVVKEDNKVSTKFGTRDVSHVISTVDIDTSKLEEADPRDINDDSSNTGELEFERISESTNIYETALSIITITSHVRKIYSTNKKDNRGVPILRFDADHEVAILEKPNFDKPLPETDDNLQSKEPT